MSRHENQEAGIHADLFSLTKLAAATMVSWRGPQDRQTYSQRASEVAGGRQAKHEARVLPQLSQSLASQAQPPHPVHPRPSSGFGPSQ